MLDTPTRVTAALDHLPRDVLLHLYERMLLIRRFEERVADLYAQGKLPGFVHLYVGQEAIAVGVCAALQDDDFITSTHRGHGHTIAKGGDISEMMAELYGKSTGSCRGKGGSLHITDMSVGMLGANGIVSGGIPIAVGAAYGAAKIRRSDQVAAAFFGDGATGEGQFHEACNVASAWKLPVVFVCENNLFGVSTRLGRVSATEDVVRRAAAYGMPAASLDGNNVVAVYEAATQAIARAREGRGPTLLECKTWRHRGHFEGEKVTYWNDAEVQGWLARDPILAFRRHLLEADVVTPEELDDIGDWIQARLDEAVEFAEKSPLPDPADALEDIFA
jgi:pyruvate dehydrogenase E1 component alpha subunit